MDGKRAVRSNGASLLEVHLKSIMKKANGVAWSMVKRYGRPLADVDDLRHELLVDLIKRLPKFRAERGHIAAFATMVFANQARVLARRHFMEQALFMQLPISTSGLRQMGQLP